MDHFVHIRVEFSSQKTYAQCCHVHNVVVIVQLLLWIPCRTFCPFRSLAHTLQAVCPQAIRGRFSCLHTQASSATRWLQANVGFRLQVWSNQSDCALEIAYSCRMAARL